MRRNILGDDRSCGNDCALTYAHTFQDHGATSNPDAIFDNNGLGYCRPSGMSVEVGIHDKDIPSDLYAPSDPYRAAHDDVNISVEIGSLADEQLGIWVHLKPDPWLKRAAFDHDPTTVVYDHRHRPSRKGQDESFRTEMAAKAEPTPKCR